MKLPVPPPHIADVLAAALRAGPSDPVTTQMLMGGIGPAPGGKYRHWDELRHLEPPPPLTPEQYWAAVKLARRSISRPLPLLTKTGRPFTWSVPSVVQELLHQVDRDAGRILGASAPVTGDETQATYLLKSVIEESITSSQLEGASTTRRIAKDMILGGREPRNRSERMILNNYNAMQHVRSLKGERITAGHVIELQRILTDGALDDPSAAGRFRRRDEEIVVEDETGTLLHQPPEAHELPDRLQRLVNFANGGAGGEFMHPVIRAALVHFALGYDHPFVDGNGRTARALFYWVMAREGYWLCEYVSISSILKRARAQYARSYLYTETDDNDTTYFVLYQLRTLTRAIRELHTYLERKEVELREVRAALQRRRKLEALLNQRQLALLNHAAKHARAEFTIRSHQTAHGVAYATARSDLLELVSHRLLSQQKRGRQAVFVAGNDLSSILQLPSSPSRRQ